MSGGPAKWLLLVHHLPPKPGYLRAKVLRRMLQLGAVPLKKSAYLLPGTDSALEDFQWLGREITQDGGAAWVIEGRLLSGATDEQIRDSFRAARTDDYAALATEARALLARAAASTPTDAGPQLEPERQRLARRFAATREIDFFEAEGRQEVAVLLDAIDRRCHAPEDRPAAAAPAGPLRARVWLTRAGVKVDRMASAWLIKRFIDPAATFAFAAPGEPPLPGAVRFDMFDGEFTHDGDRCTFEVLLAASGHGDDPGLIAIAQAVHDLDLKDERYQRSEAAGLATLLNGIVARFSDDGRRLAESAPVFDALHAGFGGTTRDSDAGASR